MDGQSMCDARGSHARRRCRECITRLYRKWKAGVEGPRGHTGWTRESPVVHERLTVYYTQLKNFSATSMSHWASLHHAARRRAARARAHAPLTHETNETRWLRTRSSDLVGRGAAVCAQRGWLAMYSPSLCCRSRFMRAAPRAARSPTGARSAVTSPAQAPIRGAGTSQCRHATRHPRPGRR